MRKLIGRRRSGRRRRPQAGREDGRQQIGLARRPAPASGSAARPSTRACGCGSSRSSRPAVRARCRSWSRPPRREAPATVNRRPFTATTRDAGPMPARAAGLPWLTSTIVPSSFRAIPIDRRVVNLLVGLLDLAEERRGRVPVHQLPAALLDPAQRRPGGGGVDPGLEERPPVHGQHGVQRGQHVVQLVGHHRGRPLGELRRGTAGRNRPASAGRSNAGGWSRRPPARSAPTRGSSPGRAARTATRAPPPTARAPSGRCPPAGASCGPSGRPGRPRSRPAPRATARRRAGPTRADSTMSPT